MKTIITSLSIFLCSLMVQSQCSIAPSIMVFPQGCMAFSVANASVTNCPEAVHIVQKLSYGMGSYDGVTGNFFAYYDSVMFYDTPFVDQYLNWYVPGDVLVCLTINAYDVNFNLLQSQQTCQMFYLDPPPGATASNITPASGCETPDGSVSLSIFGGLPPYTFYLYSNSMNMSDVANSTTLDFYNLPPDDYFMNFTDAFGCNGQFSFTIPANATNLSGIVYADNNGNYYEDAGEPLLEGIELHIVELDITAFTDASGHVTFPELAPGAYTLEYAGTDGAYAMSGASQITVNNTGCFKIGLLPLGVTIFEAWNAYSSYQDIHCVNGYNPGIYLHNIGSVPLNGNLTLSFDPMFTVDYLTDAVAYTASSPGLVTWEIGNLSQSSALNYKCHINGPGVDNVFQNFTFTFHLILYDENNTVIYDNTWTNNPLIICGYDPNDLTANPVGYTDAHYILAGDAIEYRIRFQNTGNAPAENIVVMDQLDPLKFDISSLTAVQASHSFSTTTEPNGTVNFIFNNIQLPDSTSDEAGSHGYIVFTVNTLETLQSGLTISNSAQIFFDQNPPIVTNSYEHTIFDCEWTGAFLTDNQFCEGNNLTVSINFPYTDVHAWYVNNELYSTSAVLNMMNVQAGSYDFVHVMSNELCSVSNDFHVDVYANPTGIVTVNGNVLTTSGGAFYQWSLNGNEIPNANDASYTATVAGDYTVYIINADGCDVTSAVQSIVGIDENEVHTTSLFPNPMSRTAQLNLPGQDCDVYITDISGRLISSWTSISGILNIERNNMVSGIYTITILDANQNKQEIKLALTDGE